MSSHSVWLTNPIYHPAASSASLSKKAASTKVGRCRATVGHPSGLCPVTIGGGRHRLLDRNRIGRRKGVFEGFVKRLFLMPALALVAIVLMSFEFRLGNHFDFSGRNPEDFGLL
jgi:hypothetical protein